VPDQAFINRAATNPSLRMTPYANVVDNVRPAFERFVGVDHGGGGERQCPARRC
jgi:hypothetical protein